HFPEPFVIGVQLAEIDNRRHADNQDDARDQHPANRASHALRSFLSQAPSRFGPGLCQLQQESTRRDSKPLKTLIKPKSTTDDTDHTDKRGQEKRRQWSKAEVLLIRVIRVIRG